MQDIFNLLKVVLNRHLKSGFSSYELAIVIHAALGQSPSKTWPVSRLLHNQQREPTTEDSGMRAAVSTWLCLIRVFFGIFVHPDVWVFKITYAQPV